jgi:Flp pilus assembly CpaF family ATPase
MSATIDPGEALVRRLRAAVAGELTAQASAAQIGGRRLDRDDQQALARRLLDEQLERHAQECLARGETVLTPEEEESLAKAVFDRLFQLGRLQPLLDDERLLNIIANGHDRVFLEFADGTRAPGPPIAGSDAEMIEMLRDIGRRWGLSEREFNAAHPSLNVPLPDGSRLFAVAYVCDRPCMAIRRHPHLKVTLDDLERLGTIDAGLRQFLGAAVRARKQFVIAGATGAGKTTLLRALASEIPPHERIVTIETELELALDRFPDLHPNCVALEAREANVEGIGRVSAADLVRMSLRMNPDRVVVGEVRGDEVVPMLNCMSQGNDGSLCTVHSDSSATVFNKLALYALQAPERLPVEATMMLTAAAVDLVIYISRASAGRVVQSVREITGVEGSRVLTNEVFRPGHDGRAHPHAAISAGLLEELVAEGYDASNHRGATGRAA